MTIYISNDLYLSAIADSGATNRPLIGWHSVFNQSSVSSALTSSLSFPVTSIWSPDTYTFWSSTSTGITSAERSVNFTNNDGGEVNYVGIFGHNMGTDTISYKIQSSNDGSSWSDVTAAKIPATDHPIIEYFDNLTAAFFRLLFTVPALKGGIKLSHVKIGRILQLERPRYVGDTPGGMDLRIEKIGSMSYSGQYLGSVVVSQGDAFNITQENNTASFVRSSDLQNFFRHAHMLEKLSNGPTESFFYAWRPDDYPNEVQYCAQTTNFNAPTNQRSNGMMQWSMSGDAVLKRVFT